MTNCETRDAILIFAISKPVRFIIEHRLGTFKGVSLFLDLLDLLDLAKNFACHKKLNFQIARILSVLIPCNFRNGLKDYTWWWQLHEKNSERLHFSLLLPTYLKHYSTIKCMWKMKELKGPLLFLPWFYDFGLITSLLVHQVIWHSERFKR